MNLKTCGDIADATVSDLIPTNKTPETDEVLRGAFYESKLPNFARSLERRLREAEALSADRLGRAVAYATLQQRIWYSADKLGISEDMTASERMDAYVQRAEQLELELGDAQRRLREAAAELRILKSDVGFAKAIIEDALRNALRKCGVLRDVDQKLVERADAIRALDLSTVGRKEQK